MRIGREGEVGREGRVVPLIMEIRIWDGEGIAYHVEELRSCNAVKWR